MFVVLTKSDCDIKYIIFKVKNQRARPPPSSLHPSSTPRLLSLGKDRELFVDFCWRGRNSHPGGGRPGERRPPHLPGPALHRQVPTLPKPRRPPACGPFAPEGLGPLPAPPDPPNVQVPPSTGSGNTQRGWRRQPPLATRVAGEGRSQGPAGPPRGTGIGRADRSAARTRARQGAGAPSRAAVSSTAARGSGHRGAELSRPGLCAAPAPPSLRERPSLPSEDGGLDGPTLTSRCGPAHAVTSR